ncbi:MAG: hypothetical protein R3C40_05755 [Parvularculaceae bacterium]
MTAFQARNGSSAKFEAEPADGPPGRGRPNARPGFWPVAPYNRDPEKALTEAFDRNTGGQIPEGRLKTYAEALAQYHISCESKFRNADFLDRGETLRRQVGAKRITLIGKEGNKIERAGLDPVDNCSEFSACG